MFSRAGHRRQLSSQSDNILKSAKVAGRITAIYTVLYCTCVFQHSFLYLFLTKLNSNYEERQFSYFTGPKKLEEFIVFSLLAILKTIGRESSRFVVP